MLNYFLPLLFLALYPEDDNCFIVAKSLRYLVTDALSSCFLFSPAAFAAAFTASAASCFESYSRGMAKYYKTCSLDFEIISR